MARLARSLLPYFDGNSQAGILNVICNNINLLSHGGAYDASFSCLKQNIKKTARRAERRNEGDAESAAEKRRCGIPQ